MQVEHEVVQVGSLQLLNVFKVEPKSLEKKDNELMYMEAQLKEKMV